jgi:hypothetical protein
MASCRRTGTNENVSTYHSAGTGSPDYTSLATWVSATDNDLVSTTTSEVVEILAGTHDDGDVNYDGAITNSTYMRIMRPASGDGYGYVPKTDGSCAALVTVDARFIMNAVESNFKVQDIVMKQTGTYSGFAGAMSQGSSTSGQEFAGVAVIDSLNDDAGSTFYGLYTAQPGGMYCIDCIVSGIDGHGFRVGSGDTGYFYNCVAEGNGQWGFLNSVTMVAKNCIADSNGDGQFSGSPTKITCLDSDSDTINFRDKANNDYRPANNFSDAIGQGTDLSADGNYAFDDDFADARDGDMGAAKAGFPFYASNWTIGAFEYWYEPSVSGTQGGKINGVEPYKIKSRNGIEN